METESDPIEGPEDHSAVPEADDQGSPDSEQPDTEGPTPNDPSSVKIATTSDRVETPADHQQLKDAKDRDGPDSEHADRPPPEAGDQGDTIYVEPTIDMTASDEVELGLERPLPEHLGERVSVDSVKKLEPGVIPTASEAVEGPSEHAQLPKATDRDGPDSEAPPEKSSVQAVDDTAGVKVEDNADAAEKKAADEVRAIDSGDNPDKEVLKSPSSSAVSSVHVSGNVKNTIFGSSVMGLQGTRSETSDDALVEAHSGKVALVRVPTLLVEATESGARRLVGLPPIPPEPTILENIWQESVNFYDIRSILSQIWAKDETVFHSLLSEIWESPAIRSVLLEIWEEAVETVEPKSVLSEIWADPPVHVDIRSVLSQIWSDDNRERIMSILSEIWSTPAMRSILSEIWGSDAVRSILSEIWSMPAEKVDIRSILSQIWSHDDDSPPKSILSEIWELPAVRPVLSEIWGSPKLISILWEIWKEPVEKVDIRSVLSQIWSKDNDVHIRSILSEVWATPAVRTVLSEIWNPEEECKPVKETHADYRVTESEMLLEELIEGLQHSAADVTEDQLSVLDLKTLMEQEEEQTARQEHRKHRVNRYAAAADDGDLPASRPLTSRWAFGSSCRAPVVNVTGFGSTCIVYAAAQCAVIYDYCKNTQHILQGHRNCVCGLAASPNGRWLVTGDIGPDNALIVWDTAASAPLQMHFPAWLFSGPLSLAFSCDCRYVLGLWGSVSAEDSRARQQLIVWDWTLDQAEPAVVYDYGTRHGFHEHLAVSYFDPLVLATTASCRVIFFHIVDGKIEHHCPDLHNKYSPDFKCNPGNFSQTAFSTEDPYAAVSVTSKGYVILWSDRRPSAPLDPQKQPPTVKKEARKVLEISHEPITCVQFVDGVIAAGMESGEIRFLDADLRLLTWYQKFNLAPIRCMSFGLERARSDRELDATSGGGESGAPSAAPSAPPSASNRGVTGASTSLACAGPAGEHGVFPADASLEAAEFVLRDILVTTTEGYCGMINVRKSAITQITSFPVVAVRAIHVHKTKPQLAIGAYDGTIRVWDYEEKRLVGQTNIEGNNKIHAVAFSPSGLHLAVGMQTGELVILDALTLAEECARFELSRDAITQCMFSPESHLLATRDDDRVVSVYRFVADSQQWLVLGRWRAHHQPIVGILFVPSQTEDASSRLLSLGEDRVLVEYDLVNSTKENPLVLCCDVLEQQAIPLCMAMYPQLTTENFIIVANSQYKMKLYNAHTRMCRSVTLGPQYGAPIEHMKVIPRMMSCDAGAASEQHSYLAYSTCGRLGLQVLPLDGNPRKSAAVIGHPAKVEEVDCSADGQWLFSSGGEDGCVFMWEIYPEALEAMSLLGGTGMTPFYDQLEGGKDGPLYQQLEDLVYYAELLCQGEDLLEEREVSQRVPLHMATDIMRAIGFFPTEKEIEDMMHEVRYREYGETGQLVEEVHLDDIIRLYVNHRPAPHAAGDEVAWSLDALARGGRHYHAGSVSKKELLRALQAKGEHFSEKELAAVLAELLDPEAETLPQGVPLDTVEKQLPKTLSLKSFCADLLGMPQLLTQMTASAAPESTYSGSPSGSGLPSATPHQ